MTSDVLLSIREGLYRLLAYHGKVPCSSDFVRVTNVGDQSIVFDTLPTDPPRRDDSSGMWIDRIRRKQQHLGEKFDGLDKHVDAMLKGLEERIRRLEDKVNSHWNSTTAAMSRLHQIEHDIKELQTIHRMHAASIQKLREEKIDQPAQDSATAMLPGEIATMKIARNLLLLGHGTNKLP